MDSPPPNRIRLVSGDPDWNLLDRYLSGDCTPDETKAFDTWVLSDPSHVKLLASMRRVWLEAAAPLPDIDAQQGWYALQQRLDAARTVSPPRVAPRPAASINWRTPALVTGIAASIVAGAVAWWPHAAHPRVASANTVREYSTARGQRSEVTLADGTRVWLSVDSRMRLPENYGVAARDIELAGEAYFVVEHDARLPFRVRAGSSISEDLGTEFNIRAYPGDTATVVVVTAGRVSLRPAQESARHGHDAEIGRGQMGMIGTDGAVQVVDHVDVDASLAWRNGQLQFVDRPLWEVVHELERWYDLEVTVDDSSLVHVPVTASFTDQSADQAMAIIAATLGAHYTREGRVVRIHHGTGRSR